MALFFSFFCSGYFPFFKKKSLIFRASLGLQLNWVDGLGSCIPAPPTHAPPLHIPDQTLPPMARHGSVAQRPISPWGSLQVPCIPQAWTHATRHASAIVVTSSRFAALRTLRAPPVGPPPTSRH